MSVRILTLLFLFLLPFIFFARIFLGDSVFVGDFSGSDLINLHLPYRAALIDSVKEGTPPFWEKKLALGFPTFAEGQMGSLYPPNLISSLLKDPVFSLNISILLVFMVTLISSYSYFRLTKNSRAASVFGAITFSFSSFFITRIKHLNLVNTASLFPLLLLLTEIYFERAKLKYALLEGIVIALTIIAGHPQIALYSIFVISLFATFKAFLSKKFSSIKVRIKTLVLFLFLIIIVGLGLAAVQIIPTLEFAKLTRRLGTAAVLTEDFSYDPANIISLFSPYYFGNPANGTYQADIKSFGVFWENSTYIGLIPIILAILFLPVLLIKRKGDRDSLFYLFLTAFSFLVMLGIHTPLIFVLAKTVPFFSIFRFPTRFNLFLIFSLAFLAVKGFDFFVSRLRKTTKTLFTFILIFVTALDLFLFAKAYIGYIPVSEINKTPEFIKILSQDKENFRVYSLTQYQADVSAKTGWKDPKEFLKLREAVPPNDNLTNDLDSFNDRGWFEGGLSLAKRNDLESYILLGAYYNPELIGKVLGMYNVKYLISLEDSPSPDFTQINQINSLKLYENKRVMPRAYLVPRAIFLDKPDDFFRVISSPDFNPEEKVVLEGEGVAGFENAAVDSDNFKKRNTISIHNYSDTYVRIDLDLSDPAYLVLSDAYYPGWEARVDGKETPILLANHAVRAVYVRPENRILEFYYNPKSFKAGLIISLSTVLLVLGLFVRYKKKTFLLK